MLLKFFIILWNDGYDTRIICLTSISFRTVVDTSLRSSPHRRAYAASSWMSKLFNGLSFRSCNTCWDHRLAGACMVTAAYISSWSLSALPLYICVLPTLLLVLLPKNCCSCEDGDNWLILMFSAKEFIPIMSRRSWEFGMNEASAWDRLRDCGTCPDGGSRLAGYVSYMKLHTMGYKVTQDFSLYLYTLTWVFYLRPKWRGTWAAESRLYKGSHVVPTQFPPPLQPGSSHTWINH